ncbi:transcriptional regulator, TetR family [Deinococcus reticulitermitis]|uniref:Transcriptional regulator, TetR family n=1 Tax=Deinococcus reticulitermitis TaxID=856736 RepID=A0A1H7CV32_9DEIO|nr:TetR/AcrR family transcriptional regulator [Deinococcus reticulitermitis]SEJ93366.1 transcriptional regulator, TetR family [Deinococcus reticulitermitis]
MTSPSRRERHKHERLDRIKAAAWALFSTQGYESTTIRQIAERADVAPATVILHAGDKAELLLLVFHDVIAKRIQPPETTSELPLPQTLLELLRPFIRFYGDYPELARAFFREFLYGKNRWQEQETRQAQAFLALLSQLIEARCRSGELKEGTDAELLAQTVFALYQTALQGWSCGALPLSEIESTLERQFIWLMEVHRA